MKSKFHHFRLKIHKTSHGSTIYVPVLAFGSAQHENKAAFLAASAVLYNNVRSSFGVVLSSDGRHHL